MIQRLRELPSNWIGIAVAVVFWCLLWGGFDLQNILGGLLAAMLVYTVFSLPSTGRELSVRPLALVTFVGRFLYDLVVSSVQVAWFAIRPAGQPRNSVVAVTLASRSDFFLTGTGMLATLIPGSVVVEAQRSTGTLFLHVIGAADEEEAEAARQRVRDQEVRLLRALARREILEEAGLA